MFRLRSWMLFFVLCLASLAGAQDKTASPLEARASDVVGFINEPKGFDELFADDFRAKISLAELTKITGNLKTKFGRALRVEQFVVANGYSGKFRVAFEKNAVVSMSLSVEVAPPHRISGFWITGSESASDTFESVQAELKTLPGQTALAVSRLEGNALVPLVSFNADKSLAIGSTFKLYVLAELARSVAAGERSWNDVVSLQESSFPSGQLQNWPRGAPLTLHSLAALMISNSDNTATDQLIATLGRERVEKMMSEIGNSQASRNLPFLKTIEMFKLKGAPNDLAGTYARSNVAGRRALLAGQVAAMAKQDTNFDFLAKPSFISQIEWFASPLDLIGLMNWLRLHSDAPGDKTRGILAINNWLSEEEAAQWDYISHKGGSESGVRSLTFLLRSKKGGWFAVSGTWNNEQAPVDDVRFIAIMQKTVQILRKQTS